MTTTIDVTASLRAFMAEHGFDPGPNITMDGHWQRAKVPGDRGRRRSGSYVAHPEPPTRAYLENHRTGEKLHWKPDGQVVDEFDKAKWAKIQRERQAKEKQRRNRAARRYQKVWANAADPDPSHPYLVKKGMTHPRRSTIRQVNNRLVIPMRGFGKDNPISSLQLIDLDGFKRFAKGGKAGGTRVTIGGPTLTKGGPIYLCEGYATGISIHTATQCPVVVAFSAQNLVRVAKAMAIRNKNHPLIICADNDAWTSTHQGQNPGIQLAREAAEACNGTVVHPRFTDACDNPDCNKKCGKPHPTDFNDLLLDEGIDAVKRWLDPNEHLDADAPEPEPEPEPEPVEEPPPTEGEPTPEEPGQEEEAERWTDAAPFRILGYNHDDYFYLPRGTQQINTLSPSQHDRKTLLPLAPLSWWQHTFPSRKGVSWANAADALIQATQKAGVFSPKLIRGRGCWPEKDEDGNRDFVFHLGDRLVVPGSRKYYEPVEYKSPNGWIYERDERIAGPSKQIMSDDEAAEIYRLFDDLIWLDEASGSLFAGWTMLAPVCGALDWRPHVWLTGERGSGKTYVLTYLVRPLLGGMEEWVQSNTTEPGLRQDLGCDAKPVLFDEAEEGEGVGHRVQSILALARQSSSETDARVLKGSRTGKAIQYRIRSMFCLASIGGAIFQEADRSRVCMLHLQGQSQVPPEKRKAHWDEYQPRLTKLIEDKAVGRRMISRTLKLLRNGMLMETVRIFKREAAIALRDQRLGDQYGTLFAGAWAMRFSEPPDAFEARELVGSEDLETYQHEQQAEGIKALRMLLQCQERVDTSEGMKNYAVSEMVQCCMGDMIKGPMTETDADSALRRLGLRVMLRDGQWCMMVSNNSEWIADVLHHTIYSRGIRTVLKTLKDVEPGNSPVVRFAGTVRNRASVVPIRAIEEAEEAEEDED